MAKTVKVFFSADVHGSELVWRRWLTVPRHFKADIIILAGDLTGKSIIPIVAKEDGTCSCRAFGRLHNAEDEKGLNKIKEDLRRHGSYPYVCSLKEVEELQKNPRRVEELFEKLMVEGVERWIKMLDEKIPKETKAIVMPGNDDIFEIDGVINKSERVINPLGKVISLCFDYELISLDYCNPTPWDSPRECSEDELWKKLKKLAGMVEGNWDKVVCNFHCPPYGTRLDIALKLKNLRPVYTRGEPEREHVGSKSIQRFMKEYQPLIGLHGHIHECPAYDHIGKTVVLNPGSEYDAGILRGFIVEFTKDGIDKWYKVG